MSLQGQVAIVTGASAGIGEATARLLAAKGATVVLAARSKERLEALQAELSGQGSQCLVVQTDVSDPGDLQRLTESAVEQFGQIDILVNNAGVECFYHFEELPVETILQTLETNLTGTILLTRLVIPHMLQQGRGCVVNMASTAGKHCPAYGAVYGATKSGLIAFTQGLRGEYLDRGIRSTAICPGFTSSGGVYDRIVQATGRKTSTALGGTTTDAVAKAVLKAIVSGPPEVIVNWPPVRPAMVLREMFPLLGEKLANAVSRRFVKRAADAAVAEAKQQSATAEH
jgi:short-subunit dehydrogenase